MSVRELRNRGRSSSDPEYTIQGNYAVQGRGQGRGRGGGPGRTGQHNPSGEFQVPIEEEHPVDGNNTPTVSYQWMRRTMENRYVRLILGILALFSSASAPLWYAFGVEVSPLWFLNIVEFTFFVDIGFQWICLYSDHQATNTYGIIIRFISNPRKILESLPILTYFFVPKRKYLAWLRIIRFLKAKELFERFEDTKTFYYPLVRFLKLIAILLYSIHITACVLYHFGNTSDGNGVTWLSSLQIGDKNVTQLGIVQRYTASIYFATVTLSTVGYGDIHGINVKEMVLLAAIIIFSLLIWTYLGVHLTNLFGWKSRDEHIKRKMHELENYLRKADMEEKYSKEIRDHMLIKYDDDYETRILDDVPPYLLSKISQDSIENVIRNIPLFQMCSREFIKFLASEGREYLYAPGYTILERGTMVNQLHILASGDLEQVRGGLVPLDHILPTRIFGLDSLLLNEALPVSVVACKKSKTMVIRKQHFIEALEIFHKDAQQIMDRLVEGREDTFVEDFNTSEFGVRMKKNTMAKACLLIQAVYFGDFQKVKTMVELGGANVNHMDYNSISPLQMARTRGELHIANYLIRKGAVTNV